MSNNQQHRRFFISWFGLLPAMLAMCALLVACSGGGGGGGGDQTASDVTPPTVIGTVPADGATNVAPNAAITVTFSEDMAADTVNAETFTLNNGVAGVVTYEPVSRTATFTPSASLAIDTNYTATVTTGAKDLAGNAMTANQVWSFTTGATADTTPPTVSAMSPAPGATSVSADAVVTATFSEPVTNVSPTTFKLEDTGGTVVGTVSYAGTTATFTPSAPLMTGTTYTATVTTGVKDSAGNAMAADHVWSFTTAGPPTLSITNSAVMEGDSGTTDLVFTVSLSGPANGNVTVDYTTANGTATGAAACTGGVDYLTTGDTLTIASGTLSGQITITVCGDTLIEGGDETLMVKLSDESANVVLTVASAVGTIQNDDLAALNDTGVTACADGTSNQACPVTDHPGQDAQHGRDVTANDASDGKAGFSFTKIGWDGQPLLDQSVDYATTPWACVQDNVTGLMWEVKTDDGGLRDKDFTYYYDFWNVPPGSPSDTICGDPITLPDGCRAAAFMQAVRDTGLCGYNDWRLPTRDELTTLLDLGATTSPAIDANWFPNTSATSNGYWSSARYAGDQNQQWKVEFRINNSRPSTVDTSTEHSHVRLVRGGQ